MLQPAPPHRLWESLAQMPETKSHPTKCSARGCCPALPLSPEEDKPLPARGANNKGSCQVSGIEIGHRHNCYCHD